MLNKLISYLNGRRGPPQRVVTFDDKTLFLRYAPFWPDEWTHNGVTHNRPPWWRPFNILMHIWNPEPGTEEEFHDHPRWSITVCLKGRMTEKTPWSERVLTPGSVVFRGRKYIHAFKDVEPGTTTLFIVGRRNHRQNTYQVTRH